MQGTLLSGIVSWYSAAIRIPLGPNLLHYITFFKINLRDYEIICHIAEWVSNYFFGYVVSCVDAKHTMWTSDHIT